MRQGSTGAWTATVILVSLGIAFDLVEQAAIWVVAAHSGLSPDVAFAPTLAMPAEFISLGIGLAMLLLGLPASLVLGLAGNWLAIHAVTIQLPILVGLLATSSRQ